MLAKVSYFTDALQLGGSYELVEKLWERLVLTASQINVTVASSRDEVLVSSVLSPDSTWTICFQFGFLFVPVLVLSVERDAAPDFDRVVDWVRAHRQFSVEFATHGSATSVYIRTWKAGEFVRVAVAIIDRYYGDENSELEILGKILIAVGSGASLVSLSGGSHTLVECYKEYLGSGYTKTLVDYPIFDARLLKRCLQKTASVIFGTLDPFSMTEFIVARLKGAEHRDWMQSRQSLRRAIETGDLSLPGLLDVVSNIIGVWPLIVSYLKETGKKDSGDSLVVWFFLRVTLSYIAHIHLCSLI